MARVQVALNVRDLDASIEFYTKLLRTPPAKVRERYANFAVDDPPLKLVLFEAAGEPGTLNHIGIELESPDEVAAAVARANEDRLDQRVEEDVTCCYAVQRKTWIAGPDNTWEVYAVLADAPDLACDAC
jgi:catechol 2,3-dioxygenase-like lactoylglutathione lyase family enzyme